MNKNLLKNIDFNTVLDTAELVAYQPGQIVSRTLVQNRAVSVTLFAFGEGEEISSHESGGDALIYVLEGRAAVTVGGTLHHPEKGQSIVMPAGVPHAVEAPQPFKMLLLVVFPQ